MEITKNSFDHILTSPAVEVLENLYGPEVAAQQLALEHEAYTLGEARFIKQFDRQVENGQASENQAVRPIMQALHESFEKRIVDWMEATSAVKGKKPQSLMAIREIGADKTAALALKVIFSTLAKHRDCAATQLASKLGRSMEDEARFGRLRQLENNYFEKHIAKALAKRTDEPHKKAFLSAVEGHIEGISAFAEWTVEKSVSTGYKIIELAIEACQLLERVSTNTGTANEVVVLHLNETIVDAISIRALSLAGIQPIHQPMIVKPKQWTDIKGGGYWADGRVPTRFIRTGSKKALNRYADVSMDRVYAAVNRIQNTAWKIHKGVLEVVNVCRDMANPVVEDFPKFTKANLPERPDDMDTNEIACKSWKKSAAAIYRREKARVSRRMSCELTINQANKFAQFDEIYFPYNMDWRGRVYAMPQFNPQGDDMTKGLLTLAKGKPLGEKGMFWLMVHAANCASQKVESGKKTDKVDFETRIKWVRDHKQQIIDTANAPLDCTFWADMDSPFCFLAAAIELRNAWEMVDPLQYICSLPVAFDGSCSGIQHFSAMLRDEIGGLAVNLTPSEEVQDIYAIVAEKVVAQMVEDMTHGTPNTTETIVDKKTGEITEKHILGTKALAAQWDSYGVTRSVTKRSVMTLAYGSKEFGFRDQLLEDIIMPHIDAGGLSFTNANQAAGYMAKLIWEAVSKTVVKAVEAMKWLQSASKLLAAEVKDKEGKVIKERLPTHWVTSDGFPVWQEYRKFDQKRLYLTFLGQFTIQPTVTVGTKEIDAHKQASGIAPNFVHSQDASHLRATVNHAADAYGIESFAVIHDSFGTIPADADNLFRAVRESMVATYEGCNVLEDFREQFMDQLHESQLKKMPAIPEYGSLDLQDILKSDFAFA